MWIKREEVETCYDVLRHVLTPGHTTVFHWIRAESVFETQYCPNAQSLIADPIQILKAWFLEPVNNFMKLKLSLTAFEINGSTRTTFRRRDGRLRKLHISGTFWRSLGVCWTLFRCELVWTLKAVRLCCVCCVVFKTRWCHLKPTAAWLFHFQQLPAPLVLERMPTAMPVEETPPITQWHQKFPQIRAKASSRVPPRHQKQGCQRVHGTRLASTRGPADKQNDLIKKN